MFKRYQPKGMKLGFENDSVRVSNHEIAFSEEVYEKCFGKMKSIALYFDSDTNQIALKGDNIGYNINHTKAGYKTVRWGGFVKGIKFDYAPPQMKKIKQIGELWVIEK